MTSYCLQMFPSNISAFSVAFVLLFMLHSFESSISYQRRQSSAVGAGLSWLVLRLHIFRLFQPFQNLP